MSSLRQPSLLALRAFEAAARRLSFTEAARELHVSQAAISRHVRGLEQDLAVVLFRRLHRRVALTPAGRQLAGRLAVGFQQIRSAVDVVRGRPERHLRVTAEPAFAARWLVPRLDSFSAAHPDIELAIETSDEMRVLGRDADLAIRYLGAGARNRWRRAHRLLEIEGVPVIGGSRGVASQAAGDRTVLGFRLLHDDGGAGWRRWFAAAGVSGYEHLKHLHFSDHSLAIDAARRGQGVALGTAILIESEVAAGELKVIGKTRIPLGGYWLLQASDRATAGSRAHFAKWLDGQLRKC
jgi:LysR family transcriptional regulator, glycine cleavage system transcriptional activator